MILPNCGDNACNSLINTYIKRQSLVCLSTDRFKGLLYSIILSFLTLVIECVVILSFVKGFAADYLEKAKDI